MAGIIQVEQVSPEVKERRKPRFYQPELDALRFFAFLSVFWLHAAPTDYSGLARFGHLLPSLLLAIRNAAAFGLCMFFLLSSFLITKLLQLERTNTGSINLKSFYIRRVLRIWPLYITFLFGMWFLGRQHVFRPIGTGRLLAFLLFAGNIYTSRYGFTYNPIMPLWSISIEEQFYVLWPALARCGSRATKGAAWVIIIASVPAGLLIRAHAADVARGMFTSSFIQFQFFAIGALLAMKFPKELPRFSIGNRLGLLLLGGVSLLIPSGPLHVNDSNIPPLSGMLLLLGYETMVIGIIMIFLSVLGLSSRMVPPFISYLGKISFGLYVFHYLSLRICEHIAQRYRLHTGFRFFGAALLTLLLAMLSYHFFEKFFLTLKTRFSLVSSRTV